jgi:hypothetical protein
MLLHLLQGQRGAKGLGTKAKKIAAITASKGLIEASLNASMKYNPSGEKIKVLPRPQTYELEQTNDTTA